MKSTECMNDFDFDNKFFVLQWFCFGFFFIQAPKIFLPNETRTKRNHIQIAHLRRHGFDIHHNYRWRRWNSTNVQVIWQTEISRNEIWHLLENSCIYSGPNKWQHIQCEHLIIILHTSKNAVTSTNGYFHLSVRICENLRCQLNIKQI